MFDTFVRPGGKTSRGRWVACIAGVSLLHVLAIFGVTELGRRFTFKPGGGGDDSAPVTFLAGPPPPMGAPEAPKQAAAPKPKPKPKELAVPQEPQIQVAEAQPVETPEDDVQEGAEVTEDGSTLPPGVANGVEGGDPNSLGVGGGGIGEARPFEEGMTPPVRLSGPDPQYTPAALEARVEGTMSVRCVVTVDGRVEKCRSINPIPHMEQPVIQALQSRRYKPAMHQGRAIAVDYVFTVKLVMPKF